MTVSTIPFWFEEGDDFTLPFFDALVSDFFSANQRHNAERLYEVLRYRYGLEGQSYLTLEEIGIIYGFTRERARQIESEAKKLLRQLLNVGHISGRNLNVRIHPHYYEHLTRFRISLDTLNQIEREGDLVEYAASCFGVVNVDIPSLRLLLELYGCKSITLSLKGPHYAWVLGQTDPTFIQRSLAVCFNYLRDEAIAKPFDEILLNVNRPRRSRRIERSDLQLALALTHDIEPTENNLYQVKYERLRTITDKIFRLLHVHGEPMHGRDIARRVNSEAFKHGEKRRMDAHNVGSRLSADERFVSIGRSGEWALAKWNVETGTVLTLLQDALHESGEPLTSDQLFDAVSAQRPVRKTAVDSYLSYESAFVRVGKNLFALASWGMQPVSIRHPKPRKRILSKARLAEYIELVFSDLEVSELYVSDLSRAVTELVDDLEHQYTYNAVEKSPAVTILKRREGKTTRKIARYNPGYRSLLTTRDVLTKDLPLLQLIQHSVRELLRSAQDQTMSLSMLRDQISIRLSCPKATVYTAINKMDDIRKTKSNDNRHSLCTLIESRDKYAHLVQKIADASVKAEIERALRMLHVDTIDVALFQLGKLFENTLSQYMHAVEAKGQIQVTNKDNKRLFDMVNWAEKNELIADKTAPHFLRMERNDRAHGPIPDLDEREAMLATSPQIVEVYLEYIALFLGRIQSGS